jgi:glycosyltransferase involved in cell wall biosynthesis
MKVAIYVPNLAPEEGGGHTYERDIVEAVARARHATAHELVAFGYAQDPPGGWDRTSYVSLDLDLGRRLMKKVVRTIRSFRSGPAQWRSDELLRSRGIDLIWCVTGGAPTNELPYVTTVLDLQHRLQPVFPEVAAGNEWGSRERFYSREIGRAAIVIVGNGAGQAEVERFYGVSPDRIRRLPHPTPAFALDSNAADNDALARYGLAPGYVLYPAQFWAHKNHAGLLRALAILRDEHDLRLTSVFVGSDKGSQAHVQKVVDDLALGSQVRVLGFVPRQDLITLYRNAFALAYPSFFGPENLPPLEAFALGCPVVAADVPGAEEQLGNAALLFAPTSEAQLAAVLLTLHQDGALRARLIERGRERAGAQTPADFVKGMFAILDELEPVIRTWR